MTEVESLWPAGCETISVRTAATILEPFFRPGPLLTHRAFPVATAEISDTARARLREEANFAGNFEQWHSLRRHVDPKDPELQSDIVTVMRQVMDVPEMILGKASELKRKLLHPTLGGIRIEPELDCYMDKNDFCALARALLPPLKNHPTADALDIWMLANSALLKKRELILKACHDQIGATFAEARAAFNRLRADMKQPRGRPKSDKMEQKME
jgi:hypothetical protein